MVRAGVQLTTNRGLLWALRKGLLGVTGVCSKPQPECGGQEGAWYTDSEGSPRGNYSYYVGHKASFRKWMSLIVEKLQIM